MAKNIFMFAGGPIRDGGGNVLAAEDDGVWRKPLTEVECHQINRDPEIPHSFAPNAYTRWFNFNTYFRSAGCPVDKRLQLDVGDAVYTAVYPDLISYTHMYCLPMDQLVDFTFRMELVSADDVAMALAADPNDPLTGVPVRADTLDVDCADGLGDAIIDAVDKAELVAGSAYTDYRNPAALNSVTFAQPGYTAPIASPPYLRMVITNMPDPATCVTNGCDGKGIMLPTVQYGVAGVDFGLTRNSVRKPPHVARARGLVNFI